MRKRNYKKQGPVRAKKISYDGHNFASGSKMWSQVQNNIGKFQRYFKEDMFIIDNSEGSDVQSDLTSAFKQIGAWSKTIPNNRIAQQWMADQAKSDK